MFISRSFDINYFSILLVKEEWKDRIALPVEDYLHGLISLVNELVSPIVLSRLNLFPDLIHRVYSPGWLSMP
jgi:hypothetical protein